MQKFVGRNEAAAWRNTIRNFRGLTPTSGASSGHNGGVRWVGGFCCIQYLPPHSALRFLDQWGPDCICSIQKLV